MWSRDLSSKELFTQTLILLLQARNTTPHVISDKDENLAATTLRANPLFLMGKIRARREMLWKK